MHSVGEPLGKMVKAALMVLPDDNARRCARLCSGTSTWAEVVVWIEKAAEAMYNTMELGVPFKW